MVDDTDFKGGTVELVAHEEVTLPSGERVFSGARILALQNREDSPVRYCYPSEDPQFDLTALVNSGQLKLDQHS